MPDQVPLTADDLISNEPLRAGAAARIPDDADRFQHRHVARRVAQLIATPGTNVNIAVNAPWGSGKSTFFALLKEELAEYTNQKKKTEKPRFNSIDFDAWQMADATFESNFLATVAAAIDGSPKNIEQRLFRANRTVTLPFGIELPKNRWRYAIYTALVTVVAFAVFGVPAIQALSVATVTDGNPEPFWPTYMAKLWGWLRAAAAGTVLVLVGSVLLNLRKVTVQESGPAHVTQFRNLFNEIVQKSSATQVILIDELDRCAPAAVMRTLEGLRRFLGNEKCVFVVAFDRESVVETVEDELKRSVPARPGRPYYSTAGEYLDKIFTYQVALPPQPRKTFRQYARDLVLGKENQGVWGELRATGIERLERVVSILSPPHLTSPRRTKVILNDFAINARVAESFNGTWVERADEIAVLTVLQTEFPLFYADLEHHTNLLVHVAYTDRADAGESLQPLVDRYRSERAVLDTLLSPQEDEADAVASPKRALALQLKRYLQKLTDMRVDLPSADLIQLGTSTRILAFEDPAIYSAAEAATEVPRNESILALADASPKDLSKALELMLQESEGQASAEALTLRVVVGVLLPVLPAAERDALLPHVDSAWESLVGGGKVVDLTEDALRGFIGTLLPLKDGGWVRRLLTAIEGDVALHSPGYSAVTSWATDEAFVANRDLILASATSALPSQVDPLLAFLRRVDAIAGTPHLDASSAKRVAHELAPDKEANDEKSLQEIENAVRGIKGLLSVLPPESHIRRWAVSVLRQRALSAEEAEASYLNVLDEDLKRPATRKVATEEILITLVMKSSASLKSSLSSRLKAEASPGKQLLGPALLALLRLVARDDDDEAIRGGIAEIAKLARNADIQPKKVLDVIQPTYVDTSTLTRARYEALLEVAHALLRIPSLSVSAEPLTSSLIANQVVGVADTADRVHVLQGIVTESPGVMHSVVSTLREQLEAAGTAQRWVALTLLAAHNRLHALGEPEVPLSYQALHTYFGPTLDAVAVHSWIETAPQAADVMAALSGGAFKAVPIGTWRSFATRASASNRTAMWTVALQLEASPIVLRALASHGVDDSARSSAAIELTRASNRRGRTRALAVFGALPRDGATAAAVVDPLIEWMEDARLGEARMVHELFLEHHSSFPASAGRKLRPVVSTWFSKVVDRLPSGADEHLRSLGYLESPARKRRV